LTTDYYGKPPLSVSVLSVTFWWFCCGQLQNEHHKHESSGIKNFSLDERTRLGLDDDKPAVREDRKRGWDDNQGWKSVAKVAPSEHDEEVSREVKPRWCGGKMAAYL